MKVYEALAQALVKEGIDTVFTVMDEFNMDLVIQLGEQLGVRVVTARHEEGAVLMADGLRARDRTARPGGHRGRAGDRSHRDRLVTMRLRQSPVLVLAADTARNDLHNAKVFDNRRYAEATVGTFIPLRDAATLVEDLGRAFRHLRGGAGPVMLNVPGDVFQSSLEAQWHYDTPRGGRFPAADPGRAGDRRAGSLDTGRGAAAGDHRRSGRGRLRREAGDSRSSPPASGPSSRAASGRAATSTPIPTSWVSPGVSRRRPPCSSSARPTVS